MLITSSPWMTAKLFLEIVRECNPSYNCAPKDPELLKGYPKRSSSRVSTSCSVEFPRPHRSLTRGHHSTAAQSAAFGIIPLILPQHFLTLPHCLSRFLAIRLSSLRFSVASIIDPEMGICATDRAYLASVVTLIVISHVSDKKWCLTDDASSAKEHPFVANRNLLLARFILGHK